MIQFSKIDAELSIYKEKEVVIFGASSTGKKVKEILEKNGIKDIFFIRITRGTFK